MSYKLLRNLVVASVLSLPILSLADTALADKSNFVVRNNSSNTITELYVSDSSRSTWDNNILGAEAMPRGGQTRVTFGDTSPNRCLYDIRAIFSDGQVVEDYQVNVCNSAEYTFRNQ